MQEEEQGIGSLVWIIAIVAIVGLLLYGFYKAFNSADVSGIGDIKNKYTLEREEPAFCKTSREDITSSKLFREYVYNMDIGICPGPPLESFTETDPAKKVELGKMLPVLKNSVTLLCRSGKTTDEDYCGEQIFDTSTGAKVDLHFKDLHYVESGSCTLDGACRQEEGRDIYVCAYEGWNPGLFEYSESGGEKKLVIKNDPNIELWMGKAGDNLVLCIGNSKYMAMRWGESTLSWAASSLNSIYDGISNLASSIARGDWGCLFCKVGA